ncbi:unnamed protein product [Linum trigynum]|uniref:Uncharacterized protein n=1 Tax=Linum trigynum TaxID=586398 RepID=A0AAV2D229_9ROSI
MNKNEKVRKQTAAGRKPQQTTKVYEAEQEKKRGNLGKKKIHRCCAGHGNGASTEWSQRQPDQSLNTCHATVQKSPAREKKSQQQELPPSQFRINSRTPFVFSSPAGQPNDNAQRDCREKQLSDHYKGVFCSGR